MIESATLGILARLLGVDAAELQVRPLPGGISNRGCLLTCGSDQWAVRLPLATGNGSGSGTGSGKTLDLETEGRVLALAAEARLAPEMLVCDAETGALVTRYLQGATSLNAEQVRQHANIDRIAATLRRLHSLSAPTGLRAFRPRELARIYIDAARAASGASRELADERRRWSLQFERLARDYEAAFEPTALCHNDLVGANILDDGQLWLVDFEYAVRADPVLDLAGLAGLNGFGPAQTHRLMDAYYRQGSAPVSIAQLNQVVRLVRLMAFFWALVHGGSEATDDREIFAAAMAAVLR